MVACIGIRREDKSPWERRSPLTPEQVHRLRQEADVQVVIQPSSRRIFEDAAYAAAGAQLSESLSSCRVILGIKEIPPQNIEPGKTYVFFSHTIKGQPHNMPMLRRLLELGCQLIDYERITDAAGRRLIYFGRYAGLAGMIDALWALGRRLHWEGIDTPFMDLRRAWEYGDLETAKEGVRAVGARIAQEGVPPALQPLIVGIAGYGNVSRGAQEIFDLLPFQEAAPAQLAGLFERLRQTDHQLYKVIFREEDMVEPLIPVEHFELQDYYQRPHNYRSRFESYLPYLTIMINAIYWESRYPRLVTRASLKQLFAQGAPYLRVIGDLSCDIEGAVECTDHCVTPDQPVYVYHPRTGLTTPGVAGDGPVILAVDILPAELPREASQAFGEALMPLTPALARADYDVPLDECHLPDEVRRAIICYRGELTPAFRYLERHLLERAGAGNTVS